VAVLEEEYLRWDFGYDAIETIKKRLDEMYVDNSDTCSELKLNSEG
jgi:hypothetical protein